MDGEVLVERRRQRSPGHKAALLAEVEAEGGQVSVVARRHGVSTSLLYNWRSAWEAAALATRATAVRPAELVQLDVVADASGESSTVPMGVGAVCPRGAGLALAERVGVTEIDLPDGVRVRVDSSVNEKALRRVPSGIAGARMIALPPGTKVFLASQPIDLRAGFDGLAAKAQQIIGADPFSGHVFIFRSKRGHYLKGLYWEPERPVLGRQRSVPVRQAA